MFVRLEDVAIKFRCDFDRSLYALFYFNSRALTVVYMAAMLFQQFRLVIMQIIYQTMSYYLAVIPCLCHTVDFIY